MPKTQIKDQEEDAFDKNGILKDGRSFHVDVRLCDAMSRDVAKHASNFGKPTKQHLVDGHGNAGLSLNRPGFRKLDGGSARTQQAWDRLNKATDQAYAIDEHFKTNAWRDAILDENDDDDIAAATQEAKTSDCYRDYQTEISEEWRRGNE